jgi:hypothetical protein
MAGVFHGEFGASTRPLPSRVLLTATDAATTLTPAQAIGSVVTIPASTSRAVTTPIGTAIIADLDEFRVGSTFEVTIVNTGAGTVTFTAGASGVTITGSPTVGATSSATFLGRVASATTVVYYRM